MQCGCWLLSSMRERCYRLPDGPHRLRCPPPPCPAGVMPEGDPSNQYTRSVDIFAFGLLMLELVAGKPPDRTGETGWQEALEAVDDEAARAFIARCCAPSEDRASARELLEDPFLQVGGWVGAV